MRPGGLLGLQIRRASSKGGVAGFDSQALPPFLAFGAQRSPRAIAPAGQTPDGVSGSGVLVLRDFDNGSLGAGLAE